MTAAIGTATVPGGTITPGDITSAWMVITADNLASVYQRLLGLLIGDSESTYRENAVLVYSCVNPPVNGRRSAPAVTNRFEVTFVELSKGLDDRTIISIGGFDDADILIGLGDEIVFEDADGGFQHQPAGDGAPLHLFVCVV